MVEFLSPGITLTERPSTSQVIAGISTSNMAICGVAYRGPVNDPQLITSASQFDAVYGPLISAGLTPLEVSAFFANDGRRTYVNRIVASDAVKSTGKIPGSGLNTGVQQNIGTGTAGTTDTFTATLVIPAGSRISPDTINVRKNGTGTYGSGTLVGVDTGFGVVYGANITGTINYDLGTITVTETGAVFGVGDTVDIDYRTAITWGLNASSKGVWGNGEKVRVEGSPDYLTIQNNPPKYEYSKYRLKVYLREPITDPNAAHELLETFDNLDFDTLTSSDFVVEVVNDGSDLITMDTVVTPPGGPTVLDGIAVTSESTSAIGDGTEKHFPLVVAHPAVAARTMRLTALDALDVTMVVTDDGNGNLIGDIDGTGTNTVIYSSGTVDVTFVRPVKTAAHVIANYAQSPVVTYVESTLAGGTDGVAAIGRTQISSPALEAGQEGIYAFNKVDEMLQLVVPDFAGNEVILGDEIDFAEGRRDVFVIGSTQVGQTPLQAVDFVRNVLGRNTSFCAMYYPWITVSDPLRNGRALNVPPLAHVAGIYARTDNNKNVGKAPAGTEDGALRYAIGLERVLSQGERDTVFQGRINPLISSAATGRAVWGSRTLSLNNDFRQVGARRLFMFVEKSVFNATHWITFESINAGLFSRIRLTLVNFLLNLYNQGYFAGNTPTEAFFVTCDTSNNPPAQQEAGLIVVDVGIAPQNPAEFVWFRFTRKTIQAG